MRKYQVMDGNKAAAYISYAFTELAAIYPITPSSPMAEMVDEWSVAGKKNVFGDVVQVDELQSEAGAAATVHGALKTGILATTYTASQGLLLMLPNMYEMAGELLPAVFHVASRTVATNALSIFGDHSDVMAARQTGFAMLAEGSVQEVMDLSAVAHLAAIEGRVPFINFFDGFRTSHELQKIEVLDYQFLRDIFPMRSYMDFKDRKMNPNHPHISGTAQNSDIHFQQRELVNTYYEKIPYIVQKYMKKINKIRGTNYDLVNYYGDTQATEIIVAMGSVTETIKQTVDHLNATGRHVGLISIHLYRPFPTQSLLQHLPKTVEKIAVLDRTKEPGADGEPLLEDVKSALYYHENRPIVIGGRYGLASKDTTPDQIVAIYDELLKDLSHIKKEFTIGIEDDITNLSLPKLDLLDLTPEDSYQALFYGYGSDGTVSATKQAIKIIGEQKTNYVQGYFVYDSKKSGGLTISHLRASNQQILSTYLIKQTDYVGCHNAHYLHKYDILSTLKKGGTFVLNTQWDKEQILTHLPKKIKKEIADKQIQFYVIDAYKIAAEYGLHRHINTIMAETFFAVTNVIDEELATNELLKAVEKTYAKKTEDIIDKNKEVILHAKQAIEKVDYPTNWTEIDLPEQATKRQNYVDQIVQPILAGQGDQLSLSTMQQFQMDDGRMPLGTSQFEQTVPALEVPHWDVNKCTQCNECSFICPHAAIRPILLDKIEKDDAPEGYLTQDFKGEDGLYYRIQVAVDKCTGCNLCVDACPSGALSMRQYDQEKEQAINWAFSMTVKQKQLNFKTTTTKSSQFRPPLLEFSGACSGCGETPYVKLLTQLYGERLMIANATGCSSIWGASSPTTPYTTNIDGCGPAWSNSLLEDAAEYGYGMHIANNLHRKKLAKKMRLVLMQDQLSQELKDLMQEWVNHLNDSDGTVQRAAKLKALLLSESQNNTALQEILEDADFFVKPSQWIVGGDGWAYDIGYGGLDHILASGANVNMLVLDNEVYANTGGQNSKATPEAAIAKFAAGGKREMKKDLGQMAMVYDNVYVAQVSANANPMQTIKAFEEAEKYDGPSLIIAYTPCIAHGLQGGLHNASQEAREAVESGYWALYRYNPESKKPMTLDYKRPDFSKLKDFLLTQNRFKALQKIDNKLSEQLFAKIQKYCQKRFFEYANKAGLEEKLRQKLLKEEHPSKDQESSAEDRKKAREERRKAREARKRAQANQKK